MSNTSDKAKKVAEEVCKLNKVISANQGLITGATQRIGVNRTAIGLIDKEIRELNSFYRIVSCDHEDYRKVLAKKKKIVANAGKIDIKCAQGYSIDMANRLNGLRTTSTDAAFTACLTAIKAKIVSLSTKKSGLESVVALDEASLGQWNNAIKNAKRSIKTLKENI